MLSIRDVDRPGCLPPQSQLNREEARRDEFFVHNALRLTEYALMILASHYPARCDLSGCAICGEPWRCPLVAWAADWILVGQRTGVFAHCGLVLGRKLAALLRPAPVGRRSP
jgi:hypothetical protein